MRFPAEPGYHKLEVETWRPRGSLQSEIHSFFLGGSIRIHKLEELIRTKFIDEQGMADVVNRFGLETENSGKIRVNLNMCLQDAGSRKLQRKKVEMRKEALLLETKKQVMQYKLKIKEQLDQVSKDQLLNRRNQRKARKDKNDGGGIDFGEQSYAASDGDDYFSGNEHDFAPSERSARYGQTDYDGRDHGGMQM